MRLLLALLVLALGGLAFGLQDTSEPSALERWQAKSVDDKRLLVERFQKLRALSSEDRAQLLERAHDLEMERQGYVATLPPQERAHLHSLPPIERTALLREHQIEERRRQGEELRADLGPDQEGWIEDWMHGPRPRPFHELRRDLRTHLQGRVLDHWNAANNLTPAERKMLDGTPPPERSDALLRIHRERIEAVIEREGLPNDVDRAKWNRARGEERPESFLKRARKLGLDQLAPPPPGGSRNPARMERLRELRDALRPTLEDRLATAEVHGDERRLLMDAQIAQRIRLRLADASWMPDLDRSTLATLDNVELVLALRRFAGLDEGGMFSKPGHERAGQGPRFEGGSGEFDPRNPRPERPPFERPPGNGEGRLQNGGRPERDQR